MVQHVADLANVFRRVLEDGFARGRYVIGNGVNSTVAELTEAAAAAVGAAGAVPGSEQDARARLGRLPQSPRHRRSQPAVFERAPDR